MLDQPGNAVGLVTAPGYRHIARALGTPVWRRQVGFGKDKTRRRVCLAACDFVTCQLAILDRVIALDADACLAIGDRLHFQRMEAAQIGDLVKGETGVVDQPYGGCLRHKQLCHNYLLSAAGPENRPAQYRVYLAGEPLYTPEHLFCKVLCGAVQKCR